MVQPPQDSPAALWFHQGRLALFAVTVRAAPRHRSDKGETVIYFFQVYGEVHNPTKADELLKVVQSWAITMGSVPVFICGDFNLTHEESSVLQSWDRRCLFTDLNVHFSGLKQVVAQATNTAGRRIDHVWANRHGLRIVKSFDVECDHFATHHTLKFVLDMKAFHQFGLMRHKPSPLDLRESLELNDQTLQAIRSLKQRQWHDSKSAATNLTNSLEVRRAAVDAMLDIWSERAERFLVARSGGVWCRALHQRGRVQPLKKSHVTLPCTRSNIDIHEAKERLFRVQQAHNLQRRLRAVERMSFGAQRWQTWFKLEKDLRKLFFAAGINFTQEPHLDIPSSDLFTSLHSDICFLISHFQGIAARKAKKQARDALRTSAKFKYIRNSALPPQAFVNVAGPGEEADFTPDMERIDAKIREYWEDIWKEQPRDQAPLERMFLQSLPAGQHVDFNLITAADVGRAITKCKGVGGADGWTSAELKAVSPFFDQLADFYNVMEISGVMPSVSLVGDVSLIPKSSGSISYKEMLPITVLGLIHRIYAAVRLRKTLFTWQELQIRDEACMGCRMKASTKDLTWPLCLQLERHLLTGAELFGASYDLSKAFDQLPLGNGGFLWQLMDKLCFPSPISNLMKDMYQNLTRRFKFNGYLGQPITSTGKRGALQGCAFSMVAMNVAALAWFAAIKRGFSLESWNQLYLRYCIVCDFQKVTFKRCKIPFSRLAVLNYVLVDMQMTFTWLGLPSRQSHVLTRLLFCGLKPYT